MARFARNGWIRGFHVIEAAGSSSTQPLFDGTGALTIVDSFTMGFQCVLEAIGYVTNMVAGASAGSQVFKLRKGGTSGTVLATLTLALANVNALGEVTQALTTSAAIGDKTLFDGDTWSLTRDASGTSFTTKPEGYFYLRFRQLPQADA